MKRNAFTLVELLVVIAIITVIMSLLLPGLRRARVRAMVSVCGSNQRSIMYGITEYAQDFSDVLPHERVGATLGYSGWYMLVGGKWYTDFAGDTATGVEYVKYTPPASNTSIGGSSKAWLCPLVAFDNAPFTPPAFGNWNEQYAMNDRLLAVYNADPGNSPPKPVKASSIPGTQAVLSEIAYQYYPDGEHSVDEFNNQSSSTGWGPDGSGFGPWAKFAPWPIGAKSPADGVFRNNVTDDIHGRCFNAGFIDAHVEALTSMPDSMYKPQ